MRKLILMLFVGFLTLVAAPPGALAIENVRLQAMETRAIDGIYIDITSERLPGDEESWIALVIVLSALSCAWLLNHKSPGTRVLGTILAASSCLAVAAWFWFYIMGTGFLENPKPFDAPFDAAKPSLLWLQTLVAGIAGVGLLMVAYRQFKKANPEPLN